MVDASERYAIERAKWDAHAGHSGGFKPLAENETFETWCSRDPLLVRASQFLGDVRGKDIIEYGCGMGLMSILLARSGANVFTFDISERSVDVAREQALRYGVESRITFAVAAAEAMPYPDARFDLAFGKAVLHHIDPSTGAPELARIMRPGARGAFTEPLGTNPVVKFVRDYVPYPYKHERGADIPLRYSDVDAWMAPFAAADIEGIQLLSMVERGFGFKRSIGPLRSADRVLLQRWPGLWHWCRYGVLTMTR